MFQIHSPRPLYPIQQHYAAFLEATALSFDCESCDRLVPQVGPQCILGEQGKEKLKMRFWQREEFPNGRKTVTGKYASRSHRMVCGER